MCTLSDAYNALSVCLYWKGKCGSSFPTIKKVADVCKVKTSCTHLQRYLALDYAAINQIDNP